QCVPAFRPCFMAKANWAWPVLVEVARSGIGVVVSSEFELDLAWRAGFDGRRIVVVRPAKTRTFLERALDADVGLVVVECVEEASELSALIRRPVRLGLRVQLGIRAHRGESWMRPNGAMGRSKFGVTLGEATFAATKIARIPHVELTTLSTNVGSQICDARVFEQC